MIDQDGYRPNVGIILLNHNNQVFWGRRKGEDSWQFPQGGLAERENIDEAMYRELNEELGLFQEHVQIIAKTANWLHYDVPGSWNRNRIPENNVNYRGQKQIWYLLKLIGREHHINVKFHSEQEFDAWRWINYWEPIELVVKFKQRVYQQALNELGEYIQKGNR